MIGLKSKHVMVIGAGSSLIEYGDRILKYINDSNIVTIGINCMTSLCIPDYHLWTNSQRFSSQHSCINKKSNLLFGENIPIDLIKKNWNGDFIIINYKNKDSSLPYYKDNVIYGNFRTAGILAVMIAHIAGATNIDIVGMDGLTFYSKEDLDSNKKNHHCYGSGYTDDATWDQCVKKDHLVDDGLHALREYGVKFRILTPTKFKDFYVSGMI